MKSVFDESGNRIGFKLETDEEITEFNKLVDIGKRLRDEKVAKARQVFDLLKRGDETVDLDDPAGEAAVWDWQEQLDSAIHSHLDHRTIGAFVELVLSDAQSAAQAARALARHSENHSMRQQVFEWLDQNMPQFTSLDSAADAIAGKVVPVKWRTARDWIGQWKKVRSAGRP